ncbi:MAG: Crp/Fnr family transcriptional regulator [Ignavibacteria bacterium]|nr:Crp/Fnr family transcriptional regulator [Ignavibacteria bacterium]
MDRDILKNVHLFSELSESELEKIYSRCDLKTFGKGEMIFFDTEPYQGFYIVIEGSVKIFKISKDGREHIVHFIHPFNTFAEVPLLEQYEKIRNDEFTYPANAMSLEKDTKLILIRAGVFYDIVEKNKTMCLKMISTLAKRLRHLNVYIENITQDVPKRIARYILTEQIKIISENKDQIELPISKHDLAAYLGTIDETLSRALKKFQDDNVIEVDGKNIKVKDKQALVKIAAG